MWNQGNGNGYGQGPSDVYDRLNNARQVNNRDPYIEEGQHTLAVISIEEFPSEQGAAVRASFEVLESNSMRPGTKCGTVWFLQKPTPKPGMISDSDRFADFCIRLKGAPAGHPIGADIRVLVKDRAADQLARGMVIRVLGVKKTAKTTGKSFVVMNWSNVEQTPQQIAEMRQRIEAKGLVDPPRAQGQFQGAPHPAQMPQAYPAQQAQAPQYAPPQVSQAWPPAAAPQGVPPGGFLANVPPNNGGHGNGGQGGW